MAWGRRCEIGCESWPDKAIYSTCPLCGSKTVRFSNLTPMDPDEAESILSHTQFEVFYARWCAMRGQPVDGPLPEEQKLLEPV